MAKENPRYVHLNIELNDIEPNPQNNASIEDIDSLAESILRVGLHSPIEVMRKPGCRKKFVIIGGERRWRAYKKLYEEEQLEQFHKIPAYIRFMPKGDLPETFDQNILERYNIVVTNKEVREKTPDDIMEIIEASTAFYKELKRSGAEINESCRTFIARQTNMSEETIRRYKRISKSVIPPLKEMWKRGQLRQDAAYAVRTLSEEQQHIFYNIVSKREGFIGIEQVEDFKTAWQQSNTEENNDKEKTSEIKKKHTKDKSRLKGISLGEVVSALNKVKKLEKEKGFEMDEAMEEKYYQALQAIERNTKMIMKMMKMQ